MALQPPRQPKRIYTKGNLGAFLARTGKGVGRAGGALFKEVTKPGVSPRQTMGPFGRLYRYYGKRLSQPGEKVARWLSASKLSQRKKKTMMQRAKNLGPEIVESAKERDIVEEELDPMEAQMAKEIGAYGAQKIMKNVRALFRPGSGMHVTKEKIAQTIRGTTGVDKERKEYSVAVSDSYAPYYESLQEKGTTQPEMAKEFAKAEELGILNKQEVKAGEKGLDVEYFEKTKAPFHERHQSGSLFGNLARRFSGSQNIKDNKQ